MKYKGIQIKRREIKNGLSLLSKVCITDIQVIQKLKLISTKRKKTWTNN